MYIYIIISYLVLCIYVNISVSILKFSMQNDQGNITTLLGPKDEKLIPPQNEN